MTYLSEQAITKKTALTPLKVREIATTATGNIIQIITRAIGGLGTIGKDTIKNIDVHTNSIDIIGTMTNCISSLKPTKDVLYSQSVDK